MAVETPFIGREHELTRLEYALSEATRGRGQPLFIAGEPGQGKSTLIEHFLGRRREQGEPIVMLSGICSAQLGTLDAFQPFRQILADLFEGKRATAAQGDRRLQKFAERSVQLLVEIAPDLVGLLVPGGDILTRIGMLVLPEPVKVQLGRLVRRTDEQQRAAQRVADVDTDRFFGQIANFLAGLAREATLVLCLDDLQWADQGSLDLLFYLGRQLRQSKVLIIGAYRSNDVAAGRNGSRHPLLMVVHELERVYGEVVLRLDGSSEAQQLSFFRSYLDAAYWPHSFDPVVVRRLALHTDGVPLFAVELLRSLEARGQLRQDEAGVWVIGGELSLEQLPRRVESVIEERVGRLSQAMRSLLDCASVDGERFLVRTLGYLTSRDELDLVEQLDRDLVEGHRVVEPHQSEYVQSTELFAYSFRHSLFHQHVYSSLSRARRATLHRRVGEALEEIYGESAGSIAARLAYHYGEGGAFARAYFYALRAAQGQVRQRALAEAAEWCRRGQQYARHLAAPEQRKANFDLGVLEGLILLLGGQFAEAQERYEQSLAFAGQDEERAALYRMIGEVYEHRGLYNEADDLFEQGLAQLDPEARSLEWARLQVARAWIDDCRFELARARERATAALPLIEQLGDPQDRVKAYDVISNSYNPSGEWQRRLEYEWKKQAILDEAGDLFGLAGHYNDLCIIYWNLGETGRAEYYAAETLKLYRRFSDGRGEAWAMFLMAEVHAQKGELGRAGELATEGLALASRRSYYNTVEKLLTLQGDIALMAGDLRGAERFLSAGLAQARTVEVSHTVAPLYLLAYMHALRGEFEAALELIDAGVPYAAQTLSTHNFQWALGWVQLLQGQVDRSRATFAHGYAGARAARERARLLVGMAEAAAAAGYADALFEHASAARAVVRPARYTYYEGICERLLGQHAAIRGAWATAAAHLRASATRLQECGAQLEHGRTLATAAAVIEAGSARGAADTRADRLLGQARALFEHCGAPYELMAGLSLVMLPAREQLEGG